MRLSLDRYKTLINGANISQGIELPVTIGKEILLTKKDELEEKYKKFKPLVLNYLKVHETARTSDLMKEFKASFEEIHFIIKKMEMEGLVTITTE